MTPFRKRVFTPAVLRRRLVPAALHLPVFARALVRPQTSRALREQVMLAVTSVNDCRYCAWVHTGLAVSHGVDLGELEALLAGMGAAAGSPGEATAILFAQHYADTWGAPDAAWQARLRAAFTPAQRKELMAYIHLIYVANLAGNTFDALLARCSGAEVEGSALWFELVCAAVTAPVLLTIRLRAAREMPPLASARA